MDTTSGKQLKCVVVTPEKAVLDEPAEFVELPMYDGELGVPPGRAPLIGRLGAGERRIQQHGATRRLFVDGGFAQVRANVVTVLTPRALRAENINPTVATEALEIAKGMTHTPEEQSAQLNAQQRARGQLAVARHAKASPG